MSNKRGEIVTVATRSKPMLHVEQMGCTVKMVWTHDSDHAAREHYDLLLEAIHTGNFRLTLSLEKQEKR